MRVDENSVWGLKYPTAEDIVKVLLDGKAAPLEVRINMWGSFRFGLNILGHNKAFLLQQ